MWYGRYHLSTTNLKSINPSKDHEKTQRPLEVPSSPSPAELLKVYLLGRLGLLLLLELMMITNSVCYWCLGFLLSVTSPGWGDGFARRLRAF